MSDDTKCLFQLDGGDGLYFLGNYGERTADLQEARIFHDELSAHIYIDKHGLPRLAKVRKDHKNYFNLNSQEAERWHCAQLAYTTDKR